MIKIQLCLLAIVSLYSSSILCMKTPDKGKSREAKIEKLKTRKKDLKDTKEILEKNEALLKQRHEKLGVVKGPYESVLGGKIEETEKEINKTRKELNKKRNKQIHSQEKKRAKSEAYNRGKKK